MNLDDIARGKTLTIDELLSEIENIVESGTKINLSHIIDEMMDEKRVFPQPGKPSTNTTFPAK